MCQVDTWESLFHLPFSSNTEEQLLFSVSLKDDDLSLVLAMSCRILWLPFPFLVVEVGEFLLMIYFTFANDSTEKFYLEQLPSQLIYTISL